MGQPSSSRGSPSRFRKVANRMPEPRRRMIPQHHQQLLQNQQPQHGNYFPIDHRASAPRHLQTSGLRDGQGGVVPTHNFPEHIEQQPPPRHPPQHPQLMMNGGGEEPAARYEGMVMELKQPPSRPAPGDEITRRSRRKRTPSKIIHRMALEGRSVGGHLDHDGGTERIPQEHEATKRKEAEGGNRRRMMAFPDEHSGSSMMLCGGGKGEHDVAGSWNDC
uniref:Uncharacterized protein n=1 Tax=Lotharella oceanica TaxID=641309 RepID=A0A7S2TVX8_9EUKA